MTESLSRLPPLIPREVLFGNPDKLLPQISPDGKTLSYLAPYEGVLNVWLMAADGTGHRPLTRDTNRGIRAYFWSQDSKKLFFAQDAEGRENWRLYAIDVETGESTSLSLNVAELQKIEARHDVQILVARQSVEHPEEILLAINKDVPQLFDIFHLNLKTGEIRLAAKNPGNFSSWLPDGAMKVRLAMAANPDGSLDVMVRREEDDPWTKKLTFGVEDALSSAPLGFSRDGRYLLLIDSRNAEAARLVRLDLENDGLEVLAEDEHYDVSNVMIHPTSEKIQAAAFAKARTEWKVLDEDVRADFERLASLQQGDFNVYNRSRDDAMWLVGYTRDTAPLTYYAYERKAKRIAKLFEHSSTLREYELAPMEPMSFRARDGLEIHGYVTFPPRVERRGLPMVLNVHGGPWSRHRWGYEPGAQWFANRGYICLHLNFRGSVGYGKSFLNAGDKEWGRKMQWDLEDGVRWAIDEGHADPKKIAIFGASFGGYAALVGASFTPDLFCCAVDAFGPSNLVTFLENLPPYWATATPTFHKRIGDPEADREMLIARSPLFQADRIRIPMLIAQGANDVRVLVEESESVVRALRKNGVECEYLLFTDEGHGFVKPQNRSRFYQAAERFLAKHLGGRSQD